MLYHPDKGNHSEQMVRINAAYEQALGTALMMRSRNC